MTDFQKMLMVLEQIRDLLMAAIALPDDDTDECQHPEESRVLFATPQQPDHWVCSVCRYEHHGIVRN